MIFVDSWAWIALADKDDPYHRKAKAQHKKLTRARQQYVTTDYVLSETITYLYDALRPHKLKGSLTRFWLLSLVKSTKEMSGLSWYFCRSRQAARNWSEEK